MKQPAPFNVTCVIDKKNGSKTVVKSMRGESGETEREGEVNETQMILEMIERIFTCRILE